MAKMIIMQGLPASGKSTKAKELLAQGNMVRINKDLLRTMLHFDKFTGLNEAATRDAARTLARTFLSSGKSVIIDDTNLNPGTLQSWKDLAKELDAKIEYCRMDTSTDECVLRDGLREKRVGRHVIIKMALQHLDYMKGQKVVICDLDGTLCDISHRLHFVKNLPEGQKKDWKGFFEGIKDDTLRLDTAQKVKDAMENNGAKLIFVSARPETYRKETEEWLVNQIGVSAPYRVLIMREANDKREDTLVKKDIYDKYLKNLNIVKVFDDRPSVIRMWRELGLDVEDCGSGKEF